MNRRGIELSMNFIVITIISLALFIIGTSLLYKVVVGAGTMAKQIDEKMIDEIIKILATEKLTIFPSAGSIRRNDYGMTALGIENRLTSPQDFFIRINCDTATSARQVPICDNERSYPCDTYDRWMNYPDTVTVNPNQQEFLHVRVTVPKDVERGRYTFNVRVCTDAACKNPYDTTKKLYIEVV